MGALTIDQLAKFNDSQKPSIWCAIFGHSWEAKSFGARVSTRQGMSLCELKTCARCKRYKIGKILKKRLNRAERRR